MTASIYIPPVSRQTPLPALIYYLSGITCTDENARTKSNIPFFAAQHNIAVVFPDTSPRDLEGIEGLSDNWTFGYGAGFYLDATEAPYSKHFNMYTYVTKELPEVIDSSFNVDLSRSSLMGHSMGGHGALTIALKNHGKYKSVSAFAPICNATESPFS
jgi:S-formylglutathione hydrolase